MVRAPCCEKMGLKKGPWTPEEDRLLVSYIEKHGHDNWRALPKQSGTYLFYICAVGLLALLSPRCKHFSFSWFAKLKVFLNLKINQYKISFGLKFLR